MSTVVASQARRPRIAWFIDCDKNEEGIFVVSLGYRNARGEIGPFTTGSGTKAGNVKIPFGPPTKCEACTETTKDGSIADYFRFKNKREESSRLYRSSFMPLARKTDYFIMLLQSYLTLFQYNELAILMTHLFGYKYY